MNINSRAQEAKLGTMELSTRGIGTQNGATANSRSGDKLKTCFNRANQTSNVEQPVAKQTDAFEG